MEECKLFEGRDSELLEPNKILGIGAQEYLLKEEMNGIHDRWDPCLFSAHGLKTISTNKQAITWHCVICTVSRGMAGNCRST